MKSKYEICDNLYTFIVEDGIRKTIMAGIEDGVLDNEEEGISYIEEVLDFYEFVEDYEKCAVLFKMLKEY